MTLDPSFWSFPYASQRMPLLAANVVSTSQPLASAAGLAMYLRGGNAVDAALATAITLTVVEPCMNGIGGDAFALIWADGKLHGLNASGRAPKRMTAEPFQGARHHAGARLGFGDGAGRRVRLARGVGEIRQAAVRRSVRAGDPLRHRRLPRLADGAAAMAGAGRRAVAASWFSRGVCAARPRAAARQRNSFARDRRAR